MGIAQPMISTLSAGHSRRLTSGGEAEADVFITFRGKAHLLMKSGTGSKGKHNQSSLRRSRFPDLNTSSALVINGSTPSSISTFVLNSSMSAGTPLPS